MPIIFFGSEFVLLVLGWLLYKAIKAMMVRPAESTEFTLRCPKCGTVNSMGLLDPIYNCDHCFGIFDRTGRPVKGLPPSHEEVLTMIAAFNERLPRREHGSQ